MPVSQPILRAATAVGGFFVEPQSLLIQPQRIGHVALLGLQSSFVHIRHALQLLLLRLRRQTFRQPIRLNRLRFLRGARLAIRHANHNGDDLIRSRTLFPWLTRNLLQEGVIVRGGKLRPAFVIEFIGQIKMRQRMRWINHQCLLPTRNRLTCMSLAQSQEPRSTSKFASLGEYFNDASVSSYASSNRLRSIRNCSSAWRGAGSAGFASMAF